MASALVNNVAPATDGFLDCRPPSASGASFPSFGWLSPRASFSRELDDEEKSSKPMAAETFQKGAESPSKDSVVDFEFRLEDPVVMLPADELFSDGKLVPLHLASNRPMAVKDVCSPESQKEKRTEPLGPSLDPYVFSPKAPRCSSRWRELLGLKKAATAAGQSAKAAEINQKVTTTSSLATGRSGNARGLKHFLQRNRKSSGLDSSLSLPLLRDSESDSVAIPARLSLSSSSSSGPDHEDLPRLSLDSDKPSSHPINICRNPSRLRMVQHRPTPVDLSRPFPDHPPVRIGRSRLRRAPEAAIPPRGASVDSPRMNSYGKIVFHSLERSSSSPSTFNGGSRAKQHLRGMERSYSANVRVTPVLNVPVCSLRGPSKAAFGLGQFFSPQKRETASTRSGGRSNRSAKEVMAGNQR